MSKSKRQTRFTAAELAKMVFPEPKWAVKGLIGEGITLLAGSPKVGKSWFALDVAYAIAEGGKALGSIEVEEGEVLYLALEDTPIRLQRRQKKIRAWNNPPEKLVFETRSEDLANGGLEMITEWLDEHPDARLVVVDVFNKVRGPSSSQNAYQADYKAMTMLKDVADEYEVPVLIIHHTRKAASEDFLDAVSGTNGLAGAADTIAVLTRARGEGEAILSITGRDIEDDAPKGLKLDKEHMVWKLVGSATDVGVSDTRRKIMDALDGAGGKELTVKTITSITGLKADNVRQTCLRMYNDNQIGSRSKGKYFSLKDHPALSLVEDVPLNGHSEIHETEYDYVPDYPPDAMYN